MYQPEKLKARRKELKLTQKEIAEKLRISFQAYRLGSVESRNLPKKRLVS